MLYWANEIETCACITYRNNLTSIDLTDIMEKDYCGGMLLYIWEAMLHPTLPGGLSLKSTFDEKTVLKKLFGLWYNIHYVIKNGNDTIETMSTGKKALTLLELLERVHINRDVHLFGKFCRQISLKYGRIPANFFLKYGKIMLKNPHISFM